MKPIYSAMASVQQINSARAQASNMMANISTVGFKESYRYATNTVKIDGPGFATTYQPVSASEDYISLVPGPMQMTGRKLDVFMKGSTVMGVLASNGQVAFTRRGDLTPDDIGQLKTGAGNLVLGEGGGPITVPLGFEFEISGDGTIMAYDQEVPDAPGQEIGRIMLRDAADAKLVRRLDGLFEPEALFGQGGDFESGPTAPELVGGALEGSSANVAEMLVQLLDFNRSFEGRIRLVKEVKELDQSGSSMIKMA